MAIEIVNTIPEGFQTYGNKVIGYVKDGKLYLNSPAYNIMVESEDQISELAALLPPGTAFFMAGSQKTWQIGSDGSAVESLGVGTFTLDPDTMNLYYDNGEE